MTVRGCIREGVPKGASTRSRGADRNGASETSLGSARCLNGRLVTGRGRSRAGASRNSGSVHRKGEALGSCHRSRDGCSGRSGSGRLREIGRYLEQAVTPNAVLVHACRHSKDGHGGCAHQNYGRFFPAPNYRGPEEMYEDGPANGGLDFASVSVPNRNRRQRRRGDRF